MATPESKLTREAANETSAGKTDSGKEQTASQQNGHAEGGPYNPHEQTAPAMAGDPTEQSAAATPSGDSTGQNVEHSGDANAGASAYRVHIPMYEGPLDLLLDLIRQQKMNIHDIQISLITTQYLDYLHKLEELNVDVSADFIYMAATLIYIKSKMLLPPDPLATEEGQAEDPRAELVQRLVEHEKFKNAAQLLYQKQQIEENVWSKPDKSLYNDEGTEGELVVSMMDLVRVFQQVLERRKEVVRIDLQHEQFTVAQMIAALRAQILASADNSVNLIAFFEACPSRHAMIVAFLAMLEMVKLQAVLLLQEKMFGEIVVKKGKAFDAVLDENGALRTVDEEYK